MDKIPVFAWLKSIQYKRLLCKVKDLVIKPRFWSATFSGVFSKARIYKALLWTYLLVCRMYVQVYMIIYIVLEVVQI